MYITDTKKIEEAKRLLDKVEYKVLSKRKEVKAKMEEYSQFAFDVYEEDLTGNIASIKGLHILFVENSNRDYGNIFKNLTLACLDSGLPVKGLSKDDMNIAREFLRLSVEDGEILLDVECDEEFYPEDYKKAERFAEELKKVLSIHEVEARGYSQRDWDRYTFVYYAETKEAEEEFLGYAKELENIFTVCAYIATMEEYETREYRNGDTEEVLVSEDTCGFISYDGDIPDGDIAEWAGVEVGEIVNSDL